MRPARSCGRPRRAGEGQALIFGVFVMSVLAALGLGFWAIGQQLSAHAAMQSLVRAAVVDAAGSYTDSSLAGDAPAFDVVAARGRMLQTLAAGLAPYQRRVTLLRGGNAPRMVALPATPSMLLTNPYDPSEIFHHPTVCAQVHMRLGVLLNGAVGVTYVFQACGQGIAG